MSKELASSDPIGMLAQQATEAGGGLLKQLFSPSFSEMGQSLADGVRVFRLKRQVKLLEKTKKICEKNGIKPQSVNLKLLLPLLESASLEDDEFMQDKWAVLLSNLADSLQNIQNHVFPHILSQISKDEYLILEQYYKEFKGKLKIREIELSIFLEKKPLLIKRCQNDLEELRFKREDSSSHEKRIEIDEKIRNIESDIRSLNYKEKRLKNYDNVQQDVKKSDFKTYEFYNIARLGLIETVHGASYSNGTIELPDQDDEDNKEIELDLDLSIDTDHYLSDLGIQFLKACTEKKNHYIEM